MEALAQLKPVFKAGGKTTAGNASAISDGASATVVMAREKAKELGCPELAVIRSQASAGIDMKFILVAPTLAIPKVLKKEGIKIEDVDLFEINEAFAVPRRGHQELGMNGKSTSTAVRSRSAILSARAVPGC